MHTELAMDAIDFDFYDDYKTAYENKVNVSNKLVHSPCFKTNMIKISGELKKDYTNLNSFVIYMCVEGSVNLAYNNQYYNLKTGETLLLSACINHINMNADQAVILEVYLYNIGYVSLDLIPIFLFNSTVMEKIFTICCTQ